MKTSKKLLISSLIVAFLTLPCACGGQSSAASSQASQEPHTTFDVYCVNDFHGAILEQEEGRNYESGIEKYFGFLERKKAADPEHTIILSAGDMFQGSFESNANFGHLVAEAMNEIGFDAMAVGNHEFDYGIDKLLELRDVANFPFLAGNIRKAEGLTDKGDYEEFDAYTTFTRGGYKFGIVGMIGEGQTSSITSSYVANLNFDNPESYAVETSAYLKNQEKCDVVFLVIHDDAKSVAAWNVASTLSKHFDGVFCGHTHTMNNRTIGGLTALQSYCNGEAFSHLRVGVNHSYVKQISAGVETASRSNPKSAKTTAICTKYYEKEPYVSKANAIAGTLHDGYLNPTKVSDLGCHAIYEKAVAKYPTLLLAMQNKQRADVLEGEVSYRDLYKAMPFTNHVCIVDLPGEDIIREAQFQETYSRGVDTIDPNQIYRIAVIDYLLFHQNSRKEYDYFPSIGTSRATFIEKFDDFPVDITYEFVKNSLGGEFSYRDYDGSKAKGFNVFRS